MDSGVGHTDHWMCRCLYKELLSIHERDPHYDPYLNSQVVKMRSRMEEDADADYGDLVRLA